MTADQVTALGAVGLLAFALLVLAPVMAKRGWL